MSGIRADNHAITQWFFGERKDMPPLDAETAGSLAARAASRKGAIEAAGLEYVLEVLHRTGREWEDPGNPCRRRAVEALEDILPMSRPQIEASLDLIPEILDKKTLRKRIETEIGDPSYLLGPRASSTGRGLDLRGDHLVWAAPLGTVLHVSAGNVFLGLLDSLVCGLLTGNVNIVKMASDDTVFPSIFMDSLARHDETGALVGAAAVVYWKGGREEIERVFKQRCDAILFWGGGESLASWRRDLPAGTVLIEHGPRISCAVIAECSGDEFEAACRAIAKDAAIWDQRACSAPQVVFVEGDAERCAKAARLIAEALDELEKELPSGTPSEDECVEITKERELHLFREAQGEAAVFMPRDRSIPWTVTADLKPKDNIPFFFPHNRNLTVRSFSTPSKLGEMLGKWRGILQGAALCASGSRRDELTRLLLEAGLATRVTEPGRLSSAPTGAPHDGTYLLSQLTAWKSVETPPPPSLFPTCDERRRLREILVHAKLNVPLQAERMKEMGLATLAGRDAGETITSIPVLDPRVLARNSPPASMKAVSGELVERGYTLYASGGSTGEPKHVLYSRGEFETIGKVLAGCLEKAGLDEEDRAMNLFVCGNLWTSFQAVHEALEYLGCVNLPVDGRASAEDIVRYIEKLHPTALLGIPSLLLQVGRRMKELGKPMHVPKLFYAGERLSLKALDELRESFGAGLIRSAGYASVDAGTIGYQCPHCEGSVHHLLSGYQYLEILDEETYAPVEAGEEGLMVVTNLDRKLMPVIRVPTGDRGRWLPRSCPCGSPDPLFELLGRADDKLFVGGARFNVTDVEKVLQQFEPLSSIFQIVVDDSPAGEKLMIRVELRDEETELEEERLKKEFIGALLQKCEDLRHSVELGWQETPEVVLEPPGGIERVARTGKIRRVVDRRRYGKSGTRHGNEGGRENA